MNIFNQENWTEVWYNLPINIIIFLVILPFTIAILLTKNENKGF